MRYRLLSLLTLASLVASCQTNRVMMGSGQRPGTSAPVTQVMLHDSQGPQATPATMTVAEAAAFRQQ